MKIRGAARKNFLHLTAAGATGSLLAPRAAAGTGKSTKVEKAAIKGTTDALTAFITKTDARAACRPTSSSRRSAASWTASASSSPDRPSRAAPSCATTCGAWATGKRPRAIGAGGFMTSAAHAALINAASGHAMDYDDTQLSTTPDRTFGLLTHPTVPALAAALAVAERKQRVGRGVSRGVSRRVRGRVQDRRSDRSRALQPRLPLDRHDRHVRRRGRGRQADEHARRPRSATCSRSRRACRAASA